MRLLPWSSYHACKKRKNNKKRAGKLEWRQQNNINCSCHTHVAHDYIEPHENLAVSPRDQYRFWHCFSGNA